MKVFRLSIIILLILCVFVGVHSHIISIMGDSISEKADKIKKAAFEDDWSTVSELLKEVSAEWEKYSGWASLTLAADDIEQLEISLAQSEIFARLHAKNNFFGEFIMFSKLVEHIPHREGFHWEEIL